MSLKEKYPEIGNGWNTLFDLLNEVEADHFIVDNVQRHNGMMKVTFKLDSFITQAIAYRIERMSAKLCEQCGRHGFRRTELPTIQALCTNCYALKYNELDEQSRSNEE